MPSYVGFQTINGNVGWFKMEEGIFGNLRISDGQFGTEGEILFAGGAPTMMGDINCDGLVNLLDVQPFVVLLNKGGFSSKADFDQSGSVNLLDVGPFISALVGS